MIGDPDVGRDRTTTTTTARATASAATATTATTSTTTAATTCPSRRSLGRELADEDLTDARGLGEVLVLLLWFLLARG